MRHKKHESPDVPIVQSAEVITDGFLPTGRLKTDSLIIWRSHPGDYYAITNLLHDYQLSFEPERIDKDHKSNKEWHTFRREKNSICKIYLL